MTITDRASRIGGEVLRHSRSYHDQESFNIVGGVNYEYGLLRGTIQLCSSWRSLAHYVWVYGEFVN